MYINVGLLYNIATVATDMFYMRYNRILSYIVNIMVTKELGVN